MLRTLIWFIYFWLYLVFCLPAMAWAHHLEKKGERDRADALVQRCVRNWARRLLWLAGAKVTVTGEENIPDRNVVFVADHQGYFDIPTMLGYVGKPCGLLAKKEIDKIPGIRTWMRRLHCLFVDRSSAQAGMMAMREGVALLKDGRSLTIFPEGTRSRGGEMHEFKAGAFRIATMAKAPIVPVTIDGTYKLMEGNKFMMIRPAEVHVTIHPAIETAGMSRAAVQELPEQVCGIIKSAF